MSDLTSRMQAPWEETEEEVQKRLQQAQSQQTGWLGTALGLVLATTALVVLLLSR